jgi:hypothetical protein
MKEWQRPTFVELRMDAEIGSYQDDFDRDRDMPAFVTAAHEAPSEADTSAR